ncbi:MAG TPA: hypothetical protein EYO37_00135 [Nitrospina sp.]|nr:hypothetical protein [Nitrospina sp.]
MTEKEQPSTTQSEQTKSFHNSEEGGEIKLVDLLEILVRKRLLIILFVSVFTLYSMYSAFSRLPTFRATIGFLPPDELRLVSYFPKSLHQNLPGVVILNSGVPAKVVRNKPLFYKFLTAIQSYQLQEKAFIEGDFLKKFNGHSNPDADATKKIIHSIHKSISIRLPENETEHERRVPFDKTIYLDLVGTKPEVLSDYLNTLADLTKNEVIRKAKEGIRQGIQSRIDVHTEQLGFVRSREKLKRLYQINNLNKNLEIAKKLGIVENNFSNPATNTSLSVSIDPQQEIPIDLDEKQQIPIWYLYGQRALEKELEILKHQPFSDQSIQKAGPLNLEIARLSSIDLSKVDFKSVIISQPSIPPNQTESNNFISVITAMILGLFVGMPFAFFSHLMDLLREKQKSSIQHIEGP